MYLDLMMQVVSIQVMLLIPVVLVMLTPMPMATHLLLQQLEKEVLKDQALLVLWDRPSQVPMVS